MKPSVLRNAHAAAALLTKLEAISDLRLILLVMQNARPYELARATGMSRQGAKVVTDRLIKEKFFRREKQRDPLVLTYLGEDRIAECIKLVKGAVETYSNGEAMAGVVEETLLREQHRSILAEIMRGVPISAVDAIRLEDLGYLKRRPRQKVELTEEGVALVRAGRSGPLPGNGNRVTMVRLPGDG